MSRTWQSRFSIYSTGRSNFAGNPASKYLLFDLGLDLFEPLIAWSRPDVIVHCAAITDVDFCEKHADQAFKINALSLEKLQSAAPQARIIFISSDAVYEGQSSMHTEDSETRPLNIYGSTKLQGEKILARGVGNHVSVRTTIVGYNDNPQHRSFVEWMVENFGQRKRLNCLRMFFLLRSPSGISRALWSGLSRIRSQGP